MRFVCRCLLCDRSFDLDASSLPDAKRSLRVMTNCPAGQHVALPSLLAFIDVSGIRENEKSLFQGLDTKTERPYHSV